MERCLGGCASTVFLLVQVILLLLFSPNFSNLYAQSKPALFNLTVLDAIKNNPIGYPQLDSFIKEADSIVKLKPLTIIAKKKSFSPNNHDYCSISLYAWPDSNNPNGSYIIKDGLNNPEYNEYDGLKLRMIAYRLRHLSVAYYLTGHKIYRKAAVNQLNLWFLDKKTRMLPNFEYAQVQPGYNNNKGQSYGLSELSRFTIIIESIMLLDSTKGLSVREKRELKAWFVDFQNWILGSRQWHIISKTNNNNITSSVYLALAEMSLLTGNIKVANGLAEEYKEKIIEKQIEEDGRQPSELKRAVGFGYSVGNLEVIIDYCLVMESLGYHLYKDNQRKIDNAFGYLYQFVDNHDTFPYQQKSSWASYEKRLLKNMKRLTRLSADNTKIGDLASQIKLSGSTIMDLVY